MDQMLVALFFLIHHQLSSANTVQVQVEVVTKSTQCSVTCGLGVKMQTVCKVKDSQKALEESKTKSTGNAVAESNLEVEDCRDEKVSCQESWQCGIKTFTKTTGERLEIDCLSKTPKLVKKFAWRVSWRRAPGVISTDDSLFKPWQAPHLDLVILYPIEEKHAGTYRCDVLDANFRKVKTEYWGVRVLPKGVLNLDYEHAKSVWESPWTWTNLLNPYETQIIWLYIILTILSLVDMAVVFFLVFRMWNNSGSYKIPEDANCPENMSEL
ncbi:transmembrane protein 81 [Corythoichthys intestinalis]|uniref:transmembrane protein 81 n=1 Tax=Corythoichthys intestinalis TaxID=161448 RepID=UPI0025A63121|nr:transmembrane protein 81 [Corythoichthys intestinalis]XP_061802455.1 transmembrane protein 81-like [Nerophis lumbriciformis]